MVPKLISGQAAALLEASTFGMLNVVSPIVQFVLGIALFKEATSHQQLLAIAFLLVSVILHNLPTAKRI